MKPTRFRTITVLGLASGLFLGLGGSPSSMAAAEQAPGQVAVQGPSLTLVRSSRVVPGFRLRMGRGLVDRRCDEAIRLDPKLALAYNYRGFAYDKQGGLDQVIADCDEAIRLDPKLAWAYHQRGLAYDKKGDRDHAIADFDEAIRLDPKYALAYNNRGNTYNKKGDLDHAIADYAA
ncbi:MAG: tetratricopeptide repeat protein, partial [Isosphaeraceae bacterium]